MPRSKGQSEQMRAESREKILNTARRLFANYGYAACSVSEIARQAGMSKANIYWYFKSKDELFGAVLMDGFDALGTMMVDSANLAAAGITKLDHFIKSFINLMKTPAGDDFVTIVFNFIAQGGVEQFEKFDISTLEIGMSYHQALNAIFAQCQAEGVITLEIEPDLLSTFLFSFINGMLLMYPGEWEKIEYRFIQAALFRLLGVNQSIAT